MGSQLLVISVIVEAAIALHFDQSEYFFKVLHFWQELGIFP